MLPLSSKTRQQNRTWVLSAALTAGLFCIASSFYTILFWPFLPLSFCLLSFMNRQLSFAVLAASFVAHLVLWQMSVTEWTWVEAFCLGAFHWGALFILLFPKSFKAWPKILSASALVFLVLSGFVFYGSGFEASVEKWDQLVDSPLLPRSFQASAWPEAQAEMFENIVKPLSLSAGASLLSIHLLHWILYALVIWQILTALGSKQVFARRRFWLELGSWKLSEWVLVPLVISVGLLVWQFEYIFSQPFEPLVMAGWNLLVWSLFAILLRGLGIVAFMLPRLSPFLVLLMLIGLIFVGPALLILAGFGDIWFDFRRRIRSNPFSGTGSEED